ncbi:MAG: methyltransferase domain-containing protein [Desulfobacula sp.]|nr:methyltransferase domain-containing protein [Desulfobacula sp.]
MKTNKAITPVWRENGQSLEPGRVLFLFRQKELTRLSGRALRPGGLALTRMAVDFCGFDQDARILDAGCGYGMTCRYLFEDHGIRALGMDMEMDSRLKSPVRHGKEQAPVPWFVQGRIPAFPFRSGTFNGIFCECVLSLVPDKTRCLEEFFRMLKKNGKLLLTDLYIPERYKPAPIPDHDGKAPASCLDGALTILALIQALEAAGFTITLMEDHTPYLKQMVGQMVFEYGSLDRVWERLPGALGAGSIACRSGRLKPRYGMIIAEKYE